ncbi:hypothetical protein U1Q18_036537, partial [Sarracenia purpurea var. burkii]
VLGARVDAINQFSQVSGEEEGSGDYQSGSSKKDGEDEDSDIGDEDEENRAQGNFILAVAQGESQQGEVAVFADLAGPSYKLELSFAVQSVGLPKATFKFPLGEVSLEEKVEEEAKRMLSKNGIVKGHLLNGVCTTQYRNQSLNL